MRTERTLPRLVCQLQISKKKKNPFRDGEEIERNIKKFEAHLDGLDEYVDMFTKVILLDSSAMDSVFAFPCRKT